MRTFLSSGVINMLATSIVVMLATSITTALGQPSINGITIGDNSYLNWGSLTALASYPMWEAGERIKNNGDPRPVVSTVYDFVDCQMQQLCILVLTNNPVLLGQ